MFAIVGDLQLDAEFVAQRGEHRGEQAVAAAGNRPLAALMRDLAGEDAVARLAAFLIVDQRIGLLARQAIMGVERLADVGGVEFAAGAVGQRLHHLRKVRLHPLGQLVALVLLQHPGDAALARLRIDTDHRFIVAAQILGVDRQIGHVPDEVVARFLRGEALLDRVLMAAGKGGEDQFAGIGMARVDRQLVAIFDRLDDVVDVAEVETGIDPLGVHVERDGYQVAIAGALAIAEQAAFDPVGAGHDAQFRRGDAGAAVIMGVQRNDDAVAARDIAADPFDLVGIDVGRGAFDRGGQVQDQRPFGRGAQDVHHRLAAFQAEIQFRRGKGFGRIFEMPVGVGLGGGMVAQQLGGVDGDLAHLAAFHLEDDVAPGGRDGVVDMDDRLFRAAQGLERGRDQVGAGLGQHLRHDIVGDGAALHQAGNEIEFGGPRRGEADLDLLDADLDQQVEEAALLFRVHRVDQRLVAVAHVGR